LRVLENVSRAQHKISSNRHQNVDMETLTSGAERACLTSLSIKRMKQWVEDDEDKRAEKEKEDLAEKVNMAKISHEQFVKHKDRLEKYR
jgi:hypothetical protein